MCDPYKGIHNGFTVDIRKSLGYRCINCGRDLDAVVVVCKCGRYVQDVEVLPCEVCYPDEHDDAKYQAWQKASRLAEAWNSGE